MEPINWPTATAIMFGIAAVCTLFSWLGWVYRNHEPYDPTDKTMARIGKPLWTDVTETRPAKRDDGDET